jgi:hypothetical protein
MKKQLRIAALGCLLVGLFGGVAITAEVRAHDKSRGSDTPLEFLNQTDGAQGLVAAFESNDDPRCRQVTRMMDDKKAKIVLFAPGNRAFEDFFKLNIGMLDGLDIASIQSLLPEILLNLEIDDEGLCDVLLNHVSTGTKKPEKNATLAELLQAGSITVENGPEFPISVSSGDAVINYESEVGHGDIVVKKSIIHFVKSVIRNEPPPSDEAITVFVTQTAHQGDLGGLDGADAICRQRAEATGLPGTKWTAWLSDSTMSAMDRISDGEYRLVNGTLVADNKNDLIDGSLKAAINMNEYGAVQSGIVWTATTGEGISTGNTCNNWTDASSESGGCPAGDPNCGSVGSTSASSAEWTELNAAPFQCNAQYNLYCFVGSE